MNFENITLSHEHPYIDLSIGKNDSDCLLSMYDDALDELKEIHAKGVTRIVDCSNHGIGVDWKKDSLIEQETGIEIIRSTGFYKEPFLPDYVPSSSIEELADIMRKDITKGAEVIGEIGTSKGVWTENEHKIFEAASVVQKETNAVVVTHTSLGTLIRDQIDFFVSQNINMRKVIISHVALSNDLDAIHYALDKGANVAFDTIGKVKYLPEETRVFFIKQLIKEGYTKQLLMSMDITRKSHLKKNGGIGYAYMLDTFIPLLIKEGIPESDIVQIITKNFTDILEA